MRFVHLRSKGGLSNSGSRLERDLPGGSLSLHHSCSASSPTALSEVAAGEGALIWLPLPGRKAFLAASGILLGDGIQCPAFYGLVCVCLKKLYPANSNTSGQFIRILFGSVIRSKLFLPSFYYFIFLTDCRAESIRNRKRSKTIVLPFPP